MATNGKEDIGSVVMMEHVNVTIPDQQIATAFYVGGLGFTRDPYMNVVLNNMWINIGEQQFHLPTREPQVLRGHVGLVVPSLGDLRARLSTVQKQLAGTRFAYQDEGEHVAISCPWGNSYRCYAPSAEFGPMQLGIPYVEFNVPAGTAQGIARFYDRVFAAPATAEDDVARVTVGRHQQLVFRETTQPIAPYDGHHIAIYAGSFTEPYGFLKERGLVTEEITNHQFRFKDIVDPDSGQLLFEIEHEVRSMQHNMFMRPLVNRNPGQTQGAYARGHDAFIPAR